MTFPFSSHLNTVFAGGGRDWAWGANVSIVSAVRTAAVRCMTWKRMEWTACAAELLLEWGVIVCKKDFLGLVRSRFKLDTSENRRLVSRESMA